MRDIIFLVWGLSTGFFTWFASYFNGIIHAGIIFIIFVFMASSYITMVAIIVTKLIDYFNYGK